MPAAGLHCRLLALIALVLALLVAGAGCGDDGGELSNPAGGAVTPAIAKKWPEAWCAIQPGATREEVQRLMGPPSEEYTAESSPSGFEPKMIWSAYEYHFTAFFDREGRARALHINDSVLSAEQKEDLRCDKARTLE